MEGTANYMFWWGVVAILLGVYIGIKISLPVIVPIVLVVLSLGALALFYKNKNVLVAGVVVLLYSVGFLVSHIGVVEVENVLDKHIGEEILFEGIIVSEIKESEASNRYFVETIAPVATKILVVSRDIEKRSYGEKIEFYGFVDTPRDFVTDTNRVFPYKEFLKKDGAIYIVNVSTSKQITLLDSRSGNQIRHTLFDIKNKLISALKGIIPNPEFGLLLGLLFGIQTSLGSFLVEVFRASGLIHIVVLSGYNITLVAESLRRFLFFLPRQYQLLLSAIAIVLFVIMVGAHAPAARAGAMALLAIVARYLHKEAATLKLLALVFVGFIVINPLSLLYDISLHLSVLATAGLLMFSPSFDKMLSAVTDKFGFRSIISATVATQLFVLPYLAFSIGEISIVGLFANMLALPLVPFAMLFGFITAILGLLFQPLAILIGVIATFILTSIIFIAELFGTLPFATVVLPSIPILAVYMIYLFITLVSVHFLKKYENSN